MSCHRVAVFADFAFLFIELQEQCHTECNWKCFVLRYLKTVTLIKDSWFSLLNHWTQTIACVTVKSQALYSNWFKPVLSHSPWQCTVLSSFKRKNILVHFNITDRWISAIKFSYLFRYIRVVLLSLFFETTTTNVQIKYRHVHVFYNMKILNQSSYQIMHQSFNILHAIV